MRMILATIALSFLLPTGAGAETITLVCGPKQDAFFTVDFDNRYVRYRSQGLFDDSWQNVIITNSAVKFGNLTLDLNSSVLTNRRYNDGGIVCRNYGRVRSRNC
jgi:hypothetical protein